MSWEKELVDLYDNNKDKVGVIEYRGKLPYILLPPFHTTVTAQITVTIKQDGKFLDAERVAQDDKLTIIPVTEKSGSRTAGKEPHPLCDNLRYLAGDYKDYCADDGVCHELYIAQLQKWSESEFSHDKVKAIYNYLKQDRLITDLVETGVLKLDERGQLDEKENIQVIPQTKAFVRFIVRSIKPDFETEVPDECWRDRTLQECYIEYMRSEQKEKGLCYLSGNMEAISYLHSKKIRNEGDGSKLISANDSQNFTYRGRFASREEAFAVGNETSQKVHNALKWIIRKQGASFDSLTLVIWESGNKEMPDWDVDTEEIVSTSQSIEDLESFDDEEEDEYDTNDITANEFSKALRGYKKRIDNTEMMFLLGFDAATSGRLSMVEQKSLESGRYLENIEKWHQSCGWIHEKWKDGKKIQFSGMVGVKDVADILYGIESNGYLSIVDANGKKLYAKVVQKLLPCIWNGQKIPQDYVQKAIEKASNPLAYKNRRNWERVLTLACSLVKKDRAERMDKEEWDVSLDKKCKKRDYLYGRLLAVADRIEYKTFDQDKDSTRVTNAKRYMNRFSQRPRDTWKVIEESIQPYLEKLPVPEKRYYENLLDEINDLFEMEDFESNERLDGLYLLGFHCQSYDLKKYKKAQED